MGGFLGTGIEIDDRDVPQIFNLVGALSDSMDLQEKIGKIVLKLQEEEN